MRILVTGGAGYIGSHTALELLNHGHEVVVVDNLVNSHREAVVRVQQLAERPLTFHEVDLRDRPALDAILRDTPVDAVIHFAALKSVGESVEQPVAYYQNNVGGTLTLLEAMDSWGVRQLVFSSSATVYGAPAETPITEAFPLQATNPYGQTKVMTEHILRDVRQADPRWQIAILRYFNPIGAHPSGRIGEDPNGIPANLLPYITQVAAGRLPSLRIFGDQYDTPDGTGVRDYIHVVDLALGHVQALDKLAAEPGLVTYNLGTGKGYSVLDIVRTFERVTGVAIPVEVVGPRPGDIGSCYADVTLAGRELGWAAERDLEQMLVDAWRWQSQNPHGFRNLDS